MRDGCAPSPQDALSEPRCAAPTLDPRGRRTLFSVALQLGRCVDDLVELIRVNFDPRASQAAVSRIAATIERGSRCRSSEQHAPLVALERSSVPLTQPRPATRRGRPPQKTGQSQMKAAA